MRSIAPAERINIDNDPVRNFDYDDESRITAVSGACTASCTCNGLRTRIEKTESAVTQTFMRDGVGVTSPVLNDGAAAYTPGTSERRSGVTTYMHSGIKNADLQTNTSELQTAERIYDAFGNLTDSSGSFVGPFGYGGKFGYQEDGSGLKLLGHRYYDPSIGRFLTRDPIKDGTNWYAYCENNPVTAYDANGLKERPLTAGERVTVEEAIAKIREAGYDTEADQLTKMLNDGEITCDPDLDPEALTPMVGGRRRIILGSGFLTRYISSDGNGGYKYVGTEEDQRAGKLKNAGILVHELTHVFQKAGTSVFGNGEREAYGREAKFYKDWRRKNGGRLPNSSVQDLIDEANELGRGTFWPF